MVDQYLQSEIASDEEDQKKIHRAQARARAKVRSERGRRSNRFNPLRRRMVQPPAETMSFQAWQRSQQTQQQQQQQQQQPHRAGLCFACGQPGHWKSDCPTNKKNYKLSNNDLFNNESVLSLKETNCLGSDAQSSIDCYSEVSSHTVGSLNKVSEPHSKSELSPYNRLKMASKTWQEAGAGRYILSVVEEGYKIPFKEVPDVQKSRNNKSARDNPEFVSKEIKNLLKKGCISEVNSLPHVVNPLSVAYNKKGKPRLVLDCRNINKCVHTFKFKFEDINTARQMFEKGTYMYSFDIKGAYNHIDIFSSHRTFLGFAWCDEDGIERWYVYNSLPFGLCSAGHMFSKVVRVMVTFWRSKGLKVITFLDDGLGGDNSFEGAMTSSNYIRESIQRFGFLLAEEKCCWLPSLQISWLGYFICMKSCKFFISDERIGMLEVCIKSMLYQLASQKLRIVPARFAASVTGRIISMQMVLGKLVRLRSRELYKCIDSRLSWDSPVYF